MDFSGLARILLIEPDIETGKIIEEKLTDSAFDVQNVQSLAAALEVVKTWKPELVILEMKFNDDSDGFDFLKAVRRGDLPPDVPIIVTSDIEDYETIIRCYMQGATDFMAKPVDHDILMVKVERFISLNIIKKSLEAAKHDLEEEKLHLEKNITFLSRYFSKDYIKALLDGQVNAELGGETLEASILFFDLRDSTSIAEKLTPDQFAQTISEIFTDLMDLIFSTGGSVNKIMGDGIIATFGCPFPSAIDAMNAVETALKIRDYLTSYNDFKPDFLDRDIRAGMGIATGKIFAGNIGSINRMEYSVMGDPVNLAARLESLTKSAKLDILIDGITRGKIGNMMKFKRVKMNKKIKGKSKEVKIYYPTLENKA